MERGRATYYYHFDGLGSVTGITDSSGVLVEKYEYKVYGLPTVKDFGNNILLESAVGNPFLFTGRRYDLESGLFYYRHRIYDPRIGRFLQTDPFEYYIPIAPYTYVDNNPINWVDPLGLYKEGWVPQGVYPEGQWPPPAPEEEIPETPESEEEPKKSLPEGPDTTPKKPKAQEESETTLPETKEEESSEEKYKKYKKQKEIDEKIEKGRKERFTQPPNDGGGKELPTIEFLIGAGMLQGGL